MRISQSGRVFFKMITPFFALDLALLFVSIWLNLSLATLVSLASNIILAMMILFVLVLEWADPI
jgi:hypothetical protein